MTNFFDKLKITSYPKFILLFLLSIATLVYLSVNSYIYIILTLILIYVLSFKVNIPKFVYFLLGFSLISKLGVILIFNPPIESDFKTMYDAAKPINSELRNSVISFLECFDGEHTNWTFHIFYNVVPSMIILAIGIIVCLIKKKWALFFTLGVILAKVFAIILTAPDCFFMYYLPAYLVGAFLLWLFIVQCIVNRQNKENKVKLLV